MENIVEVSTLTKIYELKDKSIEAKLLGPNNIILKTIEDELKLNIIITKSCVYVNNDNLEDINKKIIIIINSIEDLIKINYPFTNIDIINIIKAIDNKQIDDLMKILVNKEVLTVLNSGKAIYPKTVNQARYINAFKNNDIIFGIGPAGTGKTYLAVLFASQALKKNDIKKIILVRPVVEAGERLGFLPGDLKEKIDPYLVPLYDALNDCFGKETVDKLILKGNIEVCPLAYMRGRTLDNAIIILDEAQNATLQQMKMFLTRLGYQSKMIITGDITQIDLNSTYQSGLIQANKILQDIKGIEFVHFERNDVMRNPIVYKIIERYEKYNIES
ncbi:MAG: PhoH family protein [Bacilli bacterium]|nr:PhoH family protein [Bacilli bacterium]